MMGDCRVERRTKQRRLQLAGSGIGLNRQHAQLCGRKQNKRCKAVGRYCSEHKRLDAFCSAHLSTTLSVPDMSSWPSPQKTSQMNVNVPVLSGMNRTFSTTPA